MSSVYDFAVTAANGTPKPLADYKGQVLLIVNVASKCGLTPQYAGLEKLYREYKDRGLRLLAFPCNDFGAQEPGTMEEIQQFCRTNYDVTFELFAKIHVIGEQAHPLYRFLTGFAGDPGDVQWNFEKFLIGRDGRIAARFRSKVTPDDPELVQAVRDELARSPQ